MCRLLAFTPNNIAPQMKRLFFHQLMLQNKAEGQNDGAGMTDGARLYKSGLPYSDLGLQLLLKLNTDLSWIGHVRSASRGTAKPSALSSHPFYFSESGLIGAHNGFISSTGSSGEEEPDVDSYRALRQLNQLIIQSNGLDSHVLNTWISTFGPYSEWAFMLKFAKDVWIIRGIRPMYWIKLLDGYVFTTSYNSLALFTEWLDIFWRGQYTFSKIREMPSHQAIRIDPQNIMKHMNISARELLPEGYFTYFLEDGQEKLCKIEGA